jgi:hypothetical protein
LRGIAISHFQSIDLWSFGNLSGLFLRSQPEVEVLPDSRQIFPFLKPNNHVVHAPNLRLEVSEKDFIQPGIDHISFGGDGKAGFHVQQGVPHSLTPLFRGTKKSILVFQRDFLFCLSQLLMVFNLRPERLNTCDPHGNRNGRGFSAFPHNAQQACAYAAANQPICETDKTLGISVPVFHWTK